MSKILAIKGNPERGKEVIDALKMLGGKINPNPLYKCKGAESLNVYYITGDENYISKMPVAAAVKHTTIRVYSLDAFLDAYPFKVGDVVAIPEYESDVRIDDMYWDGFEVQYVVYRNDEKETYTAKELLDLNDDIVEASTDNTNVTTNYCQVGKIAGVCFNKENYENEVELHLGNYEIVNRNGKTYAVLKEPTYPVTFESCLAVLGFKEYDFKLNGLPYAYREVERLARIIACRDAYWKIADNWKVDWADNTQKKYTITMYQDQIIKGSSPNKNCILSFPTEELRDKFYENFYPMITECKHLL